MPVRSAVAMAEVTPGSSSGVGSHALVAVPLICRRQMRLSASVKDTAFAAL